jgi:hypothetical protein
MERAMNTPHSEAMKILILKQIEAFEVWWGTKEK